MPRAIIQQIYMNFTALHCDDVHSKPSLTNDSMKIHKLFFCITLLYLFV